MMCRRTMVGGVLAALMCVWGVASASAQSDKPTFTAKAVRGYKIKLTWSGFKSKATFAVERRLAMVDGSYGKWFLIGRVFGGTGSFTDGRVFPGLKYEYRLRSRGGTSTIASADVTKRALANIPEDAQVTLSARANGPRSIKLSWTGGRATASGTYYVVLEMSLDRENWMPAGSRDWSQDTIPDVFTFDVPGNNDGYAYVGIPILPGTSYYFRVRYGAGGDFAPDGGVPGLAEVVASNIAKATTPLR